MRGKHIFIAAACVLMALSAVAVSKSFQSARDHAVYLTSYGEDCECDLEQICKGGADSCNGDLSLEHLPDRA